MKRLRLTGLVAGLGVGLALTTVAATQSQAADMPPSRQVYAPAVVMPSFTWTGVYAGISGGYAWGTTKWDSTSAPTGNFNAAGGLVGGTFGFNVQFGNAVFGLEGDMSWADINGSTTTNCAAGCKTTVGWLATARGRVGFAFDRFLPYLTAGVAAGNVKASSPGVPGSNQNNIGWVVGGGLEYAFSNNLSAKAEYLYVDLGKFDCSSSCGAVAPDYVNFTANIFRVGLNLRF